MTNFIPRSTSLDFITSNPATDAFTAGQKAARQAELDDLNIQSKIVSNAVDLTSAPTKLRKLNADTSNAESEADVAYRTRDSKVATSANNASLTGTNASVAAQTAPYKVSEAASGARTSAAGADVAEGTVGSKIAESQNRVTTSGAEANVAAATVPDKIEDSKIGLRQQKATALATEMSTFHKTLDMLNAGDIEGAKAYAAAAGQTIPDEVINNADVRSAVTSAAKRAKDIYPDRPADQQNFIHGFITDMAQRRQQGQPANTPTAPYEVPNAPTPQDSSGKSNYEIVHRQETDPTTGQVVMKSYKFDKSEGTLEPIEGAGAFGSSRGGAGGRDSVFQQRLKVGEALYGANSKEAADYANGRRQVTPGEAMKFSLAQAETELRNDPSISAKFKTPGDRTAWKDQRAKQIAQQLNDSNTAGTRPAASAAPAPAAKPAPAPVNVNDRVLNQTYTAPDGRIVKWMGNGWALVPQ